MPINYLKQVQLGKFGADGYRVSPLAVVDSIIEGFYVFSKDPKEHTHLVFNDGFPVLVFLQNIEDSVSVQGNKDALEIKAAWASAGSIKNVHVKYNTQTEQLFVVRFHPGAFYQLFGLSASHFRSQPVAPFTPIAERNSFNLKEFYRFSTVEEKMAFIETYVQQSFTTTNAPEILHETLAHIHKIKGNSTVQNISNDAGVNYKWLERSFVQYIGLLPKEYIQLHRFIHAYLELVETKEVDLMRIAVSNGYYDSNHFLKDFKSYTGKTPLAYLKRQL